MLIFILYETVTVAKFSVNATMSLSKAQSKFSMILLQATFEGWMEVMKDAVDSTEVGTVTACS